MASLILLGLTGYLITDVALSLLDPERDVPDETEEGPDDDLVGDDTSIDPENPILTADESFTMLLIGHDYQPDVFDDYDNEDGVMGENGFPVENRKILAQTLIILHVDQKTKTLMLTTLPANARVTDHGLTKTLGELYGEQGPAYLAERVTSLIGIPVDYYVSVGIPGLVSLVDAIGGITYRVPQDMYYYDEEEDYTISLTAGTQRLDGDRTLQLLRFNEYGDDGSSRMNIAVSVLKTIMEKVASDKDYYTNAQAIYQELSIHVQTNFAAEDVARKLDLMFLYPDLAVTANRYPGQMIKEETIIIAPETTAPETTVPGTPPAVTDPPVVTDPAVTDPDNVIVTYWYQLDIVNGRALFSAYKYTG